MCNDIYTCKLTCKSFNSPQGLTNHFRHVYENKSAEEIYLSETSSESPKCKYCDSNAKFLSFYKGYSKICQSKECKHKQAIDANRKIIDTLSKGISGYDDLILSNKDLFIKCFNGESIIDPLDGYVHKTSRFITHRSPTKLNRSDFFAYRKCKICETEFQYNVIKQSNKLCCSRSCEQHNNLLQAKNVKLAKRNLSIDIINGLDNYEFSKLCSENINSIPKHKWDDVYKTLILKSFKIKGITVFLDDIGIFCNLTPSRGKKYTNLTVKMLTHNNLLNINDLVEIHRTCSVCSSVYNKRFSFKCDSAGNFLFDGFQAKHDFCSALCYKTALKTNKSDLYHYSDELKAHQSEMMKRKILDGEFTPAVTNTWAKSRIVYNDMKFRSSWELLFYFIVKDRVESIRYEAIRIPYFDSVSNRNRIYIVDFLVDDKILVEVKPNSMYDNNLDKFESMMDYSKLHGYEILICDETYLISHLSSEILNEIFCDETISDTIKNRIAKFVRKYGIS
jgi:hypothetical protein